MGYGLALAGGGTRGAAHVGVLKALMEAGLRPDAVAGASAGGIVAGLFASGMSVSRMEQAVLHLEKHGGEYLDPDYSGLLAFMPQLLTGKGVNLSGLIKGDKLQDYFFQMTGRKHMDEAVFKLVIPAVDLISGNTICFTNSDQVREMEHVTWEWNGYLCEAMMAGASVPAILRPENWDGIFWWTVALRIFSRSTFCRQPVSGMCWQWTSEGITKRLRTTALWRWLPTPFPL